eukprot:scaffold6424_cov108-Isochrysis_galbana.AAC.1
MAHINRRHAANCCPAPPLPPRSPPLPTAEAARHVRSRDRGFCTYCAPAHHHCPPHPPEPKCEPPPATVNRSRPAASPLEVGVVPRV